MTGSERIHVAVFGMVIIGSLLWNDASRAERLRIEAVVPSECADGWFVSGELVRLTAPGFAQGADVSVEFRGGGYGVSLGSATADSAGSIDMVVTVPDGPPGLLGLPAFGGRVIARGIGPSGEGRAATTVIYFAPDTGDQDTDSIPDACDNCPNVANQDQADFDSDGVGNACDTCANDENNDEDGDGLCADVDPCPRFAGEDADLDDTGQPKPDGVCGNVDNCPAAWNPLQEDVDDNGVGDACQTADTCADGLDNDNDGLVDYPEDPGCSAAGDSSEISAALPCDDAQDNDGDLLFDFRSDGRGDPG